MVQFKQTMIKLDRALFRAARGVLFLLVLGMTLTVTFQVTMRYLFSSPPSWSVELTRILLVWMVMIGSAVAVRTGEHISITVLQDSVPPVVRKALQSVSSFMVIAFITVVFVCGLRLTLETRTSLTEAMKLPYSLVYASLPVSAGIMLIGLVNRWLCSKEVDMS